MGTDQDRERVRSRLAAASAPAAQGRPGPGGEDADDRGDGATDSPWGPGWLSGHDDESDDGEPTTTGARDWDSRRWGLRLGLGRRGALALVVVGLVAAGFAVMSVWRDRPQTQPVPPLPMVEVRETEARGDGGDGGVAGAGAESTPQDPAANPDEHLVVSVVGLVHESGLVRLPPGSRVADALAAAGGPRPGADVLGLNMAERVSDGDQILVGVAPADGGPATVGSARVGSGAATASGAGPSAGVGKVDLNAAGPDDLDALPGVGPVTAAAIVSWRTANGPFTDVEQLGEVDGIGPARLAKLRDLVTL